MARLSRENEKLQRQAKPKEEGLNLKTEWNASDPTPMLAVKNIINESRGLKEVTNGSRRD